MPRKSNNDADAVLDITVRATKSLSQTALKELSPEAKNRLFASIGRAESLQTHHANKAKAEAMPTQPKPKKKTFKP